MKQYLINIAISLDQLLNTLCAGNPDETLSSRMGKYVYRGRGVIPCVICKFLDLFEKDHCKKSIEWDE